MVYNEVDFNGFEGNYNGIVICILRYFLVCNCGYGD